MNHKTYRYVLCILYLHILRTKTRPKRERTVQKFTVWELMNHKTYRKVLYISFFNPENIKEAKKRKDSTKNETLGTQINHKTYRIVLFFLFYFFPSDKYKVGKKIEYSF